MIDFPQESKKKEYQLHEHALYFCSVIGFCTLLMWVIGWALTHLTLGLPVLVMILAGIVIWIRS